MWFQTINTTMIGNRQTLIKLKFNKIINQRLEINTKEGQVTRNMIPTFGQDKGLLHKKVNNLSKD